MNTSMVLAHEGIAAIPAVPLGKTERERIMEAGKRRITGVDQKIFMCGQCFAVEIAEGQGICVPCDELLTARERERRSIETARYALLWVLALFAFTVFVVSWILATPVPQ